MADLRIGDLVTPHGNVPRAGEVGRITDIMAINGMIWCDVRFERPHSFHGSRMERIGAEWLRHLPVGG